jgi:hypothetical protein
MVMSTRSKALGKRKRQIGNNVRSTLAGLGLVEDEEVQSAKESIASGQDGNSTDLTNDGVVTQNGAKNKRQKYFPELNKQSNHLSGKEPLNSQSSNKSSSVTIPGNNKIKAPVKKGPYVKVSPIFLCAIILYLSFPCSFGSLYPPNKGFCFASLSVPYASLL